MKKWKTKKQIPVSSADKFENLEEQLLFSLGVKSEKEKARFFEPDYEKDLRSPFKMLNMDKAVDRILSAIDKNEKIILFGDYDADGVCASVIFHDFFKKIGFENFEVYIPDRHKESYGLNMKVVDEFASKNVNLIITLDCGISDYGEIKKAKKKGIDTVVLDHHLEASKLPDAAAIIDPKQKKDEYPFKMLCGAGVAFKTVNALLEKGEFNVADGWSKWLLDMVCIATIADMVPLTDENRALVFYGLQVLKKTQRLGLLAMFEKSRIKKENITEDDVAFLIAPRINVASRMEHANTAFSLLVTNNSEEANRLADRLNQRNIERREIAGRVIEEIEIEIGKYADLPEIFFFGSKNWLPGVLGVVANRLLERYSRPVFLWGKGENADIKGSSRSPEEYGINLVELMEAAGKEFFIEYGGHALAAGCALKENKIDSLRGALQTAFNKIKKENVENILWIDKELKLEEVDFGFLEIIEKFGPFGEGNPKPIFLFEDLEIFNVKMFGNGGVHLQLDFKNNGGIISAIGFFMSNFNVDIQKGSKIDLAASVERNTFMNRNEIRLRIIDLKISNPLTKF